MQRLPPAALALCRLEGHHQIGGRGEAHLVAVLGGQVAKGDRQMRLADAGGAKEDDILGALEKAKPASSWICERGAPGAKPKSKPSSVLIAGKPATRANISRARALRASRSACSVSSRKSAKEAFFVAALWATPEYRLGTALSRSSWHSSTMR